MRQNIILSDYDKQSLDTIAKQYNVSKKGLLEDYHTIMDSNFEQDLYDIANENEEYLREEFGEYDESETIGETDEVKRGEKTLYHIQNMNICSDGCAFDDFVFADHFPTKDDLKTIFLSEFEGSDINTEEMLDEFLTSSEIYKVYAEEV